MVAFPSLAVSTAANLTGAGSGTYYLPITGILSLDGNADRYYVRMPKAGRLINPRFVVPANAATGNITLALYINGAVVAAASQLIGPGASGVFTPAWDVAVAEGDLVCYRLVRVGSTGAFSMASAQIDYVANDGTSTGWIICQANDAVLSNAEQQFTALNSYQATVWTGRTYANLQAALETLPWGTTATATAIRVAWVTGTSTGVVTVGLAKNGVEVLTASLPAGAPAAVRQTGSVALGLGDELCLAYNSRLKGGNNLRFSMVQVDVVWAAEEFQLVSLVSVRSTGSFSVPGTDNARPLVGQSRQNPAAVETGVQIRLAEAGFLTGLKAQQYLAPRSADWPTVVRKNGADTALQFVNPSTVGGPYLGVNDQTEIATAAGDLVSIVDRIPAGSGTNDTAIGVRHSTVTFSKTARPATSYANPGGSGNRTSLIRITATANLRVFRNYPYRGYSLINGDYGNNGDWTSGGHLTFDFGEPRCIDEAKFYQSTADVHGVWQWKGSTDGSTFVNVGPSFVLGGAAVAVLSSLHGNRSFYRYWRMEQVSGSVSTTPYIQGIDFRIDDGSHLDARWCHPQGWGDRRALIDETFTPAPGAVSAAFGPIDGSMLVDEWTPSGAVVDPALSYKGSFYWSNGTPTPQIVFDFKSPVTMTALLIRASDRVSQGNFYVECSDNGSTWTKVGSFEWGAYFGMVQDLVFWNQEVPLSTTGPHRYYRVRQWNGAVNQSPYQHELLFKVSGATGPLPVEVDVGLGALIVSGGRPTLVIDQLVQTSPGALLLTGGQAAIVTNVEMDVPAGALVLTGKRPTVRVGVSVSASPDRLVVEGLAPLIFTDFRAVLPQQAALAVVEPPPPPMRLSQQATLAAGYVIPPVAVSQQAVLILVDGAPCVTERCQLWRIQRRDGVEFRYTSLDRDVFYGGQRFKSCGSLNPSASEDASTLGTVSNIELEGIISDDGITEADLYGGLFDDAYVTVDLVAWGAQPEAPRRLASGWTGELSQGDTGFKMEVLGAGSRLDQQALVQMVTPGCRWVFGDARCGIDLEGLKIAGTVTGSVSRSVFGAALAGDGAGRQWENGSVRFTSGPNEGQRLEVRSVDFGAGVINLWPSAAFRADPGDSFDLYPGCDKARDGGCSLYANVINHGGFPDVPGNDSILETPDAQY